MLCCGAGSGTATPSHLAIVLAKSAAWRATKTGSTLVSISGPNGAPLLTMIR